MIEWYKSSISPVPFTIQLNDEPWAEKPDVLMPYEILKSSEEGFVSLYSALQKSPWGEGLEFEFLQHRLDPSIIIHYPNNKVIPSPSSFKDRAYVSLAEYEIKTGMVQVGGRLFSNLQNTLGAGSPNFIAKELLDVTRNGLHPNDLLLVLERDYQQEKTLVESKYNFDYTRSAYLKSLMLADIFRTYASGRNTDYGIVFIRGDAVSWAPYTVRDIHIDLLIHLFRFKLSYSEIKSKTPVEDFHSSWDGEYEYSPEEMDKFKEFPLEWFQALEPK